MSKRKSDMNYQYEVMIIVDGSVSVSDARDSISNLLSLFSNKEEYSEHVTESDTLSYPIRKKTIAHRFILNFKMSDSAALAEFNRLALINKLVLRFLVINQSKDKGWRAKHNPKKIKDYEIRQEKKKQYIESKKQMNSNPSINYAS